MLRIAICDNDNSTVLEVCSCIERWKENREVEVDSFRSGKLFEGMLREQYYDLVFLDVEMRDVDGIELGKEIREGFDNDTTQIVYMSKGAERMEELFQVQPYCFLRKPIDLGEFRKMFFRVCKKIEKETGIFEFQSGRIIHRIPLKDIVYFEGDNRRVRIMTQEKIFSCYSTIEKLFAKINMEQAGFIRIHKSYAVNTKYITSFNARQVTMANGTEFTVSAPFRENVQQWYDICKRKYT